MKRLHILKIGSTFKQISEKKGDFEDRIIDSMGLDRKEVVVLNIYRKNDPFPDLAQVSGIVITGSHEMVTDRAPWSEKTAAWIPEVVEKSVPLLGICYGHQLLAQALGGGAANNPNGLEFGTTDIHLAAAASKDALFKEMPAIFKAHVTHTQSVIRLPPGAKLLAYSSRDPHQAFSIGKNAWGIQFHPEFDSEITAAYTNMTGSALARQGDDHEKIAAACTETPESAGIMTRFLKIANNPN